MWCKYFGKHYWLCEICSAEAGKYEAYCVLGCHTVHPVTNRKCIDGFTQCMYEYITRLLSELCLSYVLWTLLPLLIYPVLVYWLVSVATRNCYTTDRSRRKLSPEHSLRTKFPSADFTKFCVQFTLNSWHKIVELHSRTSQETSLVIKYVHSDYL